MSNTIMPVTIITGFLGAGKTSLLNDILRRNPDTDFLIIENEAGEENIDGDLLDKANKNNVFELSNGCICCSLNTELGTLLGSIILSNVKYDYVLIEATGMADPGQVINIFSGARIQRYFRLDGVVCLVDAGNFLSRLNNFHEIRRQIAQSDIVLINKTDLASEAALQETEKQVRAINPLAQIKKTINSSTDIEILNCGLYQAVNVEKTLTDFSNLILAPAKKEHAHQIQPHSFTIPGYFDMEKLSWWLENFLYANADNILRIKGIINFEGLQHKIVLQSVGDNFHISKGSSWQEYEKRVSRIVFIGSNLDRNELQKNLYSLLAKTDKTEA